MTFAWRILFALPLILKLSVPVPEGGSLDWLPSVFAVAGGTCGADRGGFWSVAALWGTIGRSVRYGTGWKCGVGAGWKNGPGGFCIYGLGTSW
jgi:hypothetical protein